MNRSIFTILFLSFFVLCLVLVPCVQAHAPLEPGDNESLGTATLIQDPTKSWAIYAELHEGGEAQYYQFNITEEQKIHVMLFKSTRSEEAEFLPSFVLMGPGIGEQGDVPDYVQKPPDANTGRLVANGEQPAQATFEPFSPSSFYSLADVALNAPATGTYYIAVFESTMGGHYGLAVGDRESYTLDEWILIPFNLLSIYQWEGQSLLVILAPLITTLIIGIVFMFRQWKIASKLDTLSAWFAGLAGLLFLGTGFMTLLQMATSVAKTSFVPEVLVTAIFILIPIMLGVGALLISLKKRQSTLRTRIYLATVGIVALFLWAGLIAGTALAIIGSLLPSRTKSTRPAA